MPDFEKEKIRELWLQGFGNTGIAKELGLNENTVKSFYRWNGLIGEEDICTLGLRMWRIMKIDVNVVAG